MIELYYNNYKRNIVTKCISCIITATLTILLMYNVTVIEISKTAKYIFCVAFTIPVLLILILIFLYCIQFWNVRRFVKVQDYQLIRKNDVSYLQIPDMCISIDECGKVVILDDD
jgi:membrane protein required for beta-lactamase induction